MSIAFSEETITLQTNSGSVEFQVEIAETPEQQQLGLMHRTTLEEKHGMLFLFSRSGHMAMWMKNTLISLDMFFIDKQGKIIHIVRNTTPESLDLIAAKEPAKAVLELNAGTEKKYGIVIGNTISHRYFKKETHE